jgi:succinyl-CoA synthetase beta subunit
MRSFGIRVQKGVIALNAEEAKNAAQVLDPKGGLILKC